MPHFKIEKSLSKQGKSIICGIDEVGRGAWAGPVVVCAVILKDGAKIPGVNDSKKLTPQTREKLVKIILKNTVSYAYGQAEAHEVDREGMRKALYLASKRALAKLETRPQAIILDGIMNYIQDGYFVHLEKQADSKSVTVASASVLAKVYRDHLMIKMHQEYPHFHFHTNKGYGTRKHKAGIDKAGKCDIHRKSFNIEGAWRQILAKSAKKNPKNT